MVRVRRTLSPEPNLPDVAREQGGVVLLADGGQGRVPRVLHLEWAHPMLTEKVGRALPTFGYLGAGAQ